MGMRLMQESKNTQSERRSEESWTWTWTWPGPGPDGARDGHHTSVGALVLRHTDNPNRQA